MGETTSLRSWVDLEFTPATGAYLRRELPQGLAAAHEQSVRAHDAFADADEELYVYGTGMSRADYKQIRVRLESLDSFSKERPDGSRRDLMFVEGKMIFPIRVGTLMPKRITQVRLKQPSVYRLGVFNATSMRKYEGMFPMFDANSPDDDDEGGVTDKERDFLQTAAAQNSLVVISYSSGPGGIGSMYWAPASLNRPNYLDLVNPERLTAMDQPLVSRRRPAAAVQTEAFGSGIRPTTPTKLRMPPGEENQG